MCMTCQCWSASCWCPVQQVTALQPRLICIWYHCHAPAGITEAFVHAVLDAAALKQANAMLVLFTGAHMCLSLVMVRAAGAAGLVGADAVTMLLRIVYSLWWVSHRVAHLSFVLRVTWMCQVLRSSHYSNMH